MLDKKTATKAYSFSVPMTTNGSSGYDTDRSSISKGSRSRTFSDNNSFSSRDDDFNPTSQRLSAHEIGQKILARRRIDNQKVATFYRESDSEQPELRILIDSRRYSNLDSLIEELTRILNLKDYEKQVHSWNGRRLGDIEDFEDGGLYFFTFSPNDKRFPQALSVVTDSEKVFKGAKERAKHNWKKILNQKKRTINVITPEHSTVPWKVLIDETKLQSFSQLLHELNAIIQPKEGRVFRLCTTKGRRVRGLSEMFHGTDTFVAIISSIGMNGDERQYGLEDRTKISPRKQLLHRPSKYDVITGEGSHLERRFISIRGKTHMFDPPASIYIDNMTSQAHAKPPEQKLQLDWIYGYDGLESRDNVFILQSEELIYYIASVVVIYDVYREKQRYYAEHTMKITCMTIHPNKWYVATGQAAPESYNVEVIDHIRIWNADMLNTLAVLSLEEQNLTVTCLAFSLEDNGRKIATVDTDGHNYRLLVWNWNSREILSKSQSYEEKELAVKFHPHSNRSLLSVGKDHIFYWNWRGNLLEKYKGHFFGCDVPGFINCLAYLSNGDAVAGDSNGNLHFWPEGSRKTKYVIKNAHNGSIQSLFVLSHDVLLTYGSADQLLSLWETRDMPQQPTATIKISGDHGDVTSIAVSPNHHDQSIGNVDIFLGTNKNRILRGTFKTQFKPIIKSHDKETTSLAANPTDHCIVTAGLDKYVMCRSAEDHSVVWEKRVEFPATSVAFYPYGNVIAVGMDSGRWCVLNSKDGCHVASFQCGMDPLSCISYSSDGGDVAIGSASGEIHFFSVYDEGQSYRMVASVQCNGDKLTSLDWSKDGTHVRAMTENWDQFVCNVEKLSEVGDLRVIADFNWQTQKSVLSYETSGIWKPGSDLRFGSGDMSRDLLCVGTEYGQVRLFKYPCWNPNAQYREYSTHVGNVNQICFLPTDLHVVSSGQFDNAVMQWRIVFGRAEETGIRSGYFRRNTIEERNETRLVRERSSSLGHRRIRGSETPRVSEDDPFARPISVSPRKTGVENIADDYPNNATRMGREEINEYLNKSGKGLYPREVAYHKSNEFLDDYAVFTPVTTEQKKKRNRERTLPYLERK